MSVCFGRQTGRIRPQKNARSCDQFHFLLPSVRHSKMKFQATKNDQSPSLVDFVEPLFAFRLLAMQSVAACYTHTHTHTHTHKSTRFLIMLLCVHFAFSLGAAQGVTACCNVQFVTHCIQDIVTRTHSVTVIPRTHSVTATL